VRPVSGSLKEIFCDGYDVPGVAPNTILGRRKNARLARRMGNERCVEGMSVWRCNKNDNDDLITRTPYDLFIVSKQHNPPQRTDGGPGDSHHFRPRHYLTDSKKQMEESVPPQCFIGNNGVLQLPAEV